jgi:hypothetical protein
MTTSDQPSSVASSSRGGDKKASKKDSKDKASPSKGRNKQISTRALTIFYTVRGVVPIIYTVLKFD